MLSSVLVVCLCILVGVGLGWLVSYDEHPCLVVLYDGEIIYKDATLFERMFGETFLGRRYFIQ